jgi:hypothetical protein
VETRHLFPSYLEKGTDEATFYLVLVPETAIKKESVK